MGLSSFTFVQGAPKDTSFLRLSTFWPFKVIEGHRFWHQSKAHIWLPIVINSNLCPILHRFWDTATYWLKIAYFSYPSLIWRPRRPPMFPLEFRGEINQEETRVMGLLCGESCMILTSSVFDWSTRVADDGTDRQADGRAIAYTRYSIYAVARKNWVILLALFYTNACPDPVNNIA